MPYFDNASTTFPKFKVVYEETMKIYSEIGINFSRSSSAKSYSAGEIKKSLTSNLKKIFSTTNHEVIINSSSTFSLNEIICGLNYEKIKTVYISPFEHNAVYRCLKKKANEEKFNIEFLPFNKYELDKEKMSLMFISKKPDLVICNHASNVFGNILPVEQIFEEAKKYKSITVLDSSQTAGVLDFDSIGTVSDFMVFAGHKTLYGPSGIGGYLFNKSIKLSPLLYGGTGIKSEEIEMPTDIPERYEAGSPNILGMIALKLSTDELLRIGIKEIYNIKKSKLNKVFEIMKKYDYDINIISNEENNIGIASITMNDYSPQEFGAILSENGIEVRTGMQCSPLSHEHIGTKNTGTIRFSVGYFTADSDLEELDDFLNKIF